MDKKNDMFAVLFYQPDSTIDDLALNGITPDNTGIEDKDYYKNLKSVQDAEQFKTEGKFDEVKFNNFYDSVARVYNSYAESDWQKQILDSFAKDPYDWTDPFNSNVKDFDVTVDNSNRGRVSFGITGFNRTGNPTLSTREIAQASKMHDKNGRELDFSPNSRGFFKSIFAPTAALAQYDETGLYEENGEQILHYKGEYKLNADGDPYYEELGDKDPYGREILRVSDVVSVDGTTLNKYFDIFDSDGIDESVGKTIVKTTAKVAPLLIPGAGQVYGVVGMVAGLAESIPGLINSVNSIFGVQDTAYGKAISTADAYMGRFKETTSDYSKGKFWTFENFGNIITSSANQLFSQRTVAQLSQTLLAGGDALQARKIGQKLSLGYMALTSSTDAYADFKQAGASDRVAGIGALATMAGLYGLMSQDYFKDWLFKGQWLDENEGKDVVANWMKSKSQYYTKELLGDVAETSEKELTKAEAAGLFTKIKAGTQRIWEKFMNTSFSGKAPHLAEATDEVVKASAGKKALSIFNIMLNRSVNEGVEETMEEVVQDMTKGVFAAGEALGLDLHDEKEDELNFGWSLGDALMRYITSFAGGFFGGAVFEGITQLEYARDHKMQLSDLNDVDSQMMYMLLQGRKNDLLDYAKMYHDKNSFLSRDLSMKVIQRTSDGKLIYAPANGGQSQNDAMYDFICGEINRMDDLLHRNGFTQMALTKYMMEFDQNVDKEQDIELNLINAIKKLKVHTSFMDDMIKVGKELIAIDDGIRNIDRVISDPEKRRLRDEKESLPTDQAKASLEARKKELEKQRDELFDHKNDYKYIRQALFMLNVPLQKMLLGCLRDGDVGYKAFDEATYILSGNQGFDNYLYLKYGKTSKTISAEERAIFQKEYDAFKEEDKEHVSVDLARKLFDLSCAINKAFASPLTNAEAYLKDTTENKNFQRSIILAGTEVFQKYQIAKASLAIYDKKMAEIQSEIDAASSELNELDATKPENDSRINELNTLIQEKNNQLIGLEEGKKSAIQDISEFEAVYGDDERNMPFLGISLKRDEDGKLIDTDIAKEQREFGRKLLGLNSELFSTISNLFTISYTAFRAGEDPEGNVLNPEEYAKGEENQSQAESLFAEHVAKLQDLVNFVLDYYAGLKDRNELNASDLYLSALTRNIVNLISSAAFSNFAEVDEQQEDMSIPLKSIYDGAGQVVLGENPNLAEFNVLYVNIANALQKSDYGSLATIKADLIATLMAGDDSLTEEGANSLIDNYFKQTLGINLFDLYEKINQARRNINTYDAVDVIKSLGIADDVEVISLFERLKEEKNAILQKGTSLQEYIMDPRSKEVLGRAQSLLMLAMTAIQAAADGSNATGNAMIHSDDVDKYGVISERTASALAEDVEYYNQCIGYLLALTEANERARTGYYQKCEVSIHRNVISQLIKDADKESSWAHQLNTVFGINIPDLWQRTIAEVNSNVSLETLNKNNFSDFKQVYVKFFSKLRNEILNSDALKDENIKVEELKGKSADYKIGGLIGYLLKDKNPRLGNYGIVNQDDPLTDLTFGTYLTAILNEDYESFYKNFATVVKAQNTYAPFAAQEIAILTSFEFATSDSENSSIEGFLDSIEKTKVNLDGLDQKYLQAEKQKIQGHWDARKVLKHFIVTQGGTGSGKTSACAFFTHALLKMKYGNNMEVIVAAPDATQTKKFSEILGEEKAFNFLDLIKNFYKGNEEDVIGLLNVDMTGDASKKFFSLKDNDIKLKDIAIKELADTSLKKNTHKFLFIDEVTFLNQGALEFLENVAKKFGIKILAYGDPEQNGAFKIINSQITAESGISDFFCFSTPSLGDSIRFENSAKDDNYRVLKTQLSKITSAFAENAACVDAIQKQIANDIYNNLPLNLQIKYYEDSENFVGEKFIKGPDVQSYIEKFKRLSKELHKDDPDESKRVPNICIITDDPSKYTAEPGVSVLNPKSVQGMEYDYVIIADHTFDDNFYFALKDLYTLVGRSKKGSVVVGASSKFKIDNIPGTNVLLTPRNSSNELSDFKEWKNEVLDKFATVPTSEQTPPNSSQQGKENGAGENTDEDEESDELNDDDELDDDDNNDEGAALDELDSDKALIDHSNDPELNPGQSEDAYTAASQANQSKLDKVEEGLKYSWAEFVNWANDTETGLLQAEGWDGNKFNSTWSIFNGLELSSSSTGLVTNVIQFYRKFASAIVYNAKLNDNQKKAILNLFPEGKFREVIEKALNNWNEEKKHKFVARADDASNKTLISYVATIDVDGNTKTILIPVALINGNKSGTIITSESIFKQEGEMDLVLDPKQKKYPIFNLGLNAIGVISKPKILTIQNPENSEESVKGYIKSQNGGIAVLASDAEFLTESDFENMFQVKKDGEKITQALQFENSYSIDLGNNKSRTVYYYNLNGIRIPFMNMAVRNYTTLHNLYDIANIGLYASGSLKEDRLTESQRQLIERELGSAGISREKATQYMKRYFGEYFDVSKESNAESDRNKKLRENFRALASKFKLLGRADSYYFLGSIYAAIDGLSKTEALDETAIAQIKSSFNENLIRYLAKPENNTGKYKYTNAITLKIDKEPGSKKGTKYYTVFISWNEQEKSYAARIRETFYDYKNGKFKSLTGDPVKILEKGAFVGKNGWGSALEKIIQASVQAARGEGTDISDSEIRKQIGNGQIQLFLTNASSKKKSEGTYEDPHINLLNDYQLVSKTLNCIPSTTGAFDAIVKQMYTKGNHFKDGICLNANRIITQRGEEERSTRGWVDTPFLPNLTKTNFQGVSTRTYSLRTDLTWKENQPPYGGFVFGKQNQDVSSNFEVTEKYEVKNNTYKGKFKVTADWWHTYVDTTAELPEGSIAEINLDNNTITVQLGREKTEYKLKGKPTIEELSGGVIKSNTEETLPTMQTIDGNHLIIKEKTQAGITSINVNGEDYDVVGTLGNNIIVIPERNSPRLIFYHLTQNQVQQFGGIHFTKLYLLKDGNVAFGTSNSDLVFDKSGMMGLVKSDNFINFEDDSKVEIKKTCTDLEYQSLLDKHPNLYLVNGEYKTFGDATISSIALEDIVFNWKVDILKEDYILDHITTQGDVFIRDSEGNEYTYKLRYPDIISSWVSGLENLMLDRIHQLCVELLGEDRITVQNVEDAEKQFNELLFKKGKRCEIIDSDVKISDITDSNDSTINPELKAIEEAGYTVTRESNGNPVTTEYTKPNDDSILVYRAEQNGNIYFVVVDNGVVKTIPDPDYVGTIVDNVLTKLKDEIDWDSYSNAIVYRDEIKARLIALKNSPLYYSNSELQNIRTLFGKLNTATNRTLKQELIEMREPFTDTGEVYKMLDEYDKIGKTDKCDFK